MTADVRVKRPRLRKLPLFTRGEHRVIDNLKICYDLLEELPEHERVANLNYLADKFGYALVRKSRW